MAAAAPSAGSGGEFINQLEGAFPNVYAAIVVSSTAVAVSVVMAAILFPVFQAMMLRWWLSGLRFGALTIRSHLRTGTDLRRLSALPGYGFAVLARRLHHGGGWHSPPWARSLTVAKLTEIAEIVSAVGGVGILCRDDARLFRPSIRAR